MSAEATVFVVDPNGGGTHIEISDAVNAAAASGDTILVKSGVYDPFYTNGRALTIVADKDALVIVLAFFPNPPPTVDSLLAGESVILRGLNFQWSIFGGPPTRQPSLRLQDNDGSVRMEDCTVMGGTGFCDTFTPLFLSGSPGLLVEDCVSVAMVRCEIRGGAGAAGNPFTPCCTNGGEGMIASKSKVATYESTIAGGLGTGCADGPDLDLYQTELLADQGDGREFSATSPLRLGDTAALVFEGTPGEVALLLLGAADTYTPVSIYSGVLLTTPVLSANLAVIPPTGTLTILATPGSLLPPGISTATLRLQAAFSGGINAVIGSPSYVTLLGSGL